MLTRRALFARAAGLLATIPFLRGTIAAHPRIPPANIEYDPLNFIDLPAPIVALEEKTDSRGPHIEACCADGLVYRIEFCSGPPATDATRHSRVLFTAVDIDRAVVRAEKMWVDARGIIPR